MKAWIYSHQDCQEHDPGIGHPERSERVEVILKTLREPPIGERLVFVDAPLGTDSQILLAHTSDYLDFVKESAPESGKVELDADTVMSRSSLDAALRGVGAACLSVDDLAAGKIESAFCVTRPPGHHATPNRAMGFCMFNSIAIAALYAQTRGFNRVAIVDFDVHHGNGTQDIVIGKPGVLYISTHQSPLYPGTGDVDENVPGNILNIELGFGTTDAMYQAMFEEKVIPAIDEFAPELLLVSAGFDAHRDDPLAGLDLTEETFRWLGEQLKKVANRHCEGRILTVLEGGYNLTALASSVVAYLEGLDA